MLEISIRAVDTRGHAKILEVESDQTRWRHRLN